MYASRLSERGLLSQSLDVSLASQETTVRTAAVINLLTIIQAPNFEAYCLNFQVKSITCCRITSDPIVKKQ